jgi:hypothetical protein
LGVSGFQEDRDRQKYRCSARWQGEIMQRLNRLAHAPHAQNAEPTEERDESKKHPFHN